MTFAHGVITGLIGLAVLGVVWWDSQRHPLPPEKHTCPCGEVADVPVVIRWTQAPAETYYFCAPCAFDLCARIVNAEVDDGWER